MKKVVVFVIAAFSLIFSISGAGAQSMMPGDGQMMQGCQMMGGGMGMMGGMGMRGDHMGMMPENLLEARHHFMGMAMELGLDEKQKSAIQTIIDTTVKELIKKRSDIMIAKIDLESILHADNVDLSAAEAKMKQIEAMKTDMFMTHLKAFEEAKSLLTPVQKMKLKEMMDMHRHMMAGRGMAMEPGYADREEKHTDRPMKK